MDFDRNSMNVPVQSSDYTKKFLQKDLNPTTMEVVTQTNAVKSPTDSPETTKLVYTVERYCTNAGHQPALCLQPVQQHHRIPCPTGRRKHPCTERQFRCVALPGSLIRRQTVWHILRSAATLTASDTPTKMNTARAATNGKVFPQKRRQRTERSKSSMNWQLAHS